MRDGCEVDHDFCRGPSLRTRPARRWPGRGLGGRGRAHSGTGPLLVHACLLLATSCPVRSLSDRSVPSVHLLWPRLASALHGKVRSLILPRRERTVKEEEDLPPGRWRRYSLCGDEARRRSLAQKSPGAMWRQHVGRGPSGPGLCVAAEDGQL